MNTLRPNITLRSVTAAQVRTLTDQLNKQSANMIDMPTSALPIVSGPKPIKGTFDWIGGQDNDMSTGFHIGLNDLRAGDVVRFKEPSGRYNGEHTIKYIGADDGTYKETMVTIPVPRVAGTQTSGTWELVKRATEVDNNQIQSTDYVNNNQPVANSGISKGTAIIGLALVTVAGIAIFK